MAIISADIDNIITPKSSDLNDLVDKLSEVIVDWNCNMNYINAKLGKKPNEGNCQDFVEVELLLFVVAVGPTPNSIDSHY